MLLLEPCPDPLLRPCSTDTVPVPVPYPTPFSPIFKPGARLPRTRQRTPFFKRSVSESEYTSCCERPALAQPRPRGTRLANSSLQSHFDNAAKQDQPPSLKKDPSQDKQALRAREKDSTPKSIETQGNRNASTAKPRLRLDLAFPIIESLDTPTSPRGRTALQSPSKLLPQIYGNSCSFLANALQNYYSPIRNLRQKILENYVIALSKFNVISAFVESQDYRAKLLSIASILRVRQDPVFLEALHTDDKQISIILKTIVNCETHRRDVVALREDAAQAFLDHAHQHLNNVSMGEQFGIGLHRLLVKLSQASDKLPSSMFIEGVNKISQCPLAGGAWADVYQARYKEGLVVLKSLRMHVVSGSHTAQQQFCREVLVWTRLKHPYVLPLFGIDNVSMVGGLCMVSPLMQRGTLSRYVQERGTANVNRFIMQIAQGLEYLHSQGVVHGDLRGNNILIDDNDNIRLADFGLTVFADATIGHTSCVGGSTRWMAPELFVPEQFGLDCYRRTYASDIYAVACVAVEACTKAPPFPELPGDRFGEIAVLLRVIKGGRPERPVVDGMTDALWRLVEMCWSHDLAKRPRACEVADYMKCLITECSAVKS